MSRRQKSERGASATEYGLLVAGLAALVVALVLAFGGFINEVHGEGEGEATSSDGKPTPPPPNTDPHKGWVVIFDDKVAESDMGWTTTMIRCYGDRLVVLTRSGDGVAQSTDQYADECA